MTDNRMLWGGESYFDIPLVSMNFARFVAALPDGLREYPLPGLWMTDRFPFGSHGTYLEVEFLRSQPKEVGLIWVPKS